MTKIFTKEGWVYYVQTDHLSGEEIGSSIESLYDAGAHNVQVVPTITKKNRNGAIFLIDTNAKNKDAVEQAIILELRVSGWHRIRTDHRHLEVDYLKCTLPICYEGIRVNFEAEIKKSYGVETTLRPEHRSCERLKQLLKNGGKACSIETCSQLIRDAYMQANRDGAHRGV